MKHSLRVLVDDRGLARQVRDIWLPHIDPDVVWLVGHPPAELDELARDPIPVVHLSPTDVVAAVAESDFDAVRVLAIFADLTNVSEAALFGLEPLQVTITALSGSDDTERFAAGVELSDDDHDILRRLTAAHFEFAVQPLPNVTARLVVYDAE